MVKRALVFATVIAFLVTGSAAAHVLSISRARSKALDVGAKIATEYNAHQESNNRYVQLASDRTICTRPHGRDKPPASGNPISLARVRHRHKVVCSLYYFRHQLVDGGQDEVDYCTLRVTILIKRGSQRLHASHPPSFSCSSVPQG